MPRYVSSYREFALCAIPPAYGTVKIRGIDTQTEVDKGVDCQFQHKGLMQWEYEIAEEKLGLKGLGYDEDPRHRFSVYDTDLQALIENWDEETKTLVEQKLDHACGPDLLRIEKPKLTPPWPAYNRLIGEDAALMIADKVKNDGYEPHYCVNYERENLNRPEVIEAIQAVEAELAEGEILA